MLQNHDYNLLETITVIARSIYRYDTYMKDLDKVKCETAGSCRTTSASCSGMDYRHRSEGFTATTAYMKDLDKVKCETCRKMLAGLPQQRQKELDMLLKELRAHVEAVDDP